MENQIPLTEIKGVGHVKEEAFDGLGIRSVRDLLYYLPRAYCDYSSESRISDLSEGIRAVVRLRFLSSAKVYYHGGMSIVSASAEEVSADHARVTVRWFNQPYRAAQVARGDERFVSGLFSDKRGKSFINPSLSDSLPGFVAEYSVCRGVTQRMIREAVRNALASPEMIPEEVFPLELRERYNLCSVGEALRFVHCPVTMDELNRGRRRITFENLLIYLLAVELQKEDRRRSNGIAFRTDGALEAYSERLPFCMTGAQQRVCSEIRDSMASPVPMNRLIQGDVGSGKTAVAAFALSVAIGNGMQAVMLAPTSILAKQHYETLRKTFGDCVCILTGNMKRAEREQTIRRLRSEEPCIAIGTHALLESDVVFGRLGLVITDEQHRFGVRQRARMEQKGIRPDVLVMSATPIPRTLSMLLYGDLDMSVIDEMPPGRKKIRTNFIVGSKRRDMYRYIADEVRNGMQTYVICPLIEPSETVDAPCVTEVFEELRKDYPEVHFGILHGRMSQEEKDDAMERFRSGETDVLVSTTVIEVGVHVENANILVVEGADRFGLAQLHQLRGRVGRGNRQAYCFLLTGNASEAAKQRLRILMESADGFEIAEKDLALRGPGDFLGTRQHGEGNEELFRAAASIDVIRDAKSAAEDVMCLPTEQNNRILSIAERQFASKTGDITMN